MQRPKRFINEQLCKRVLEESYLLGCKEVGFYVTGEPLLNNNLIEYIEYAKKIGFQYIYITTNGILADLERVKELYYSGLNSIKYSINAYNEVLYKKIHGTNNFEKVISNLYNVYNWKKNNNINLNVFVSFVTTKFTNDKNKIHSLFDNLCDEVVILNAVNQGGLMPIISKNISGSDNYMNKFNLPCNYPFNSIIVTVEGYITACCMDFENLLAYGDLNKESMEEIWNNETIQNLRFNHIEKKVKNTICDNCVNNCYDIPKPLVKKYCKLNDYNILK